MLTMRRPMVGIGAAGAQEGAPDRCVIKGNINSKRDKIYQAPDMSS